MKNKYKSELLETAVGLHNIGVIRAKKCVNLAKIALFPRQKPTSG
jgi:hypothetical protein